MSDPATGPVIEYKDSTVFQTPLELKADLKKNRLEGYMSRWEELDSHDDLTEKGAFAHTIATDLPANRIKLMFWHKELIGRVTHMAEDSTGVEFAGPVDDVQRGRETLTMVKSGTIDSSSYGYFAEDFAHTIEDEEKHGKPVRRLKRVRVLEVSALPWGSLESADVRMAVKELTSRDVDGAELLFKALMDPANHIEILKLLADLGTQARKRLKPEEDSPETADDQTSTIAVAAGLKECFSGSHRLLRAMLKTEQGV